MTILSVCNLKGGSGKTTVAVHLACALKQVMGWDCVLADADRQGTATAWSEQGKLPIPVVRQELQEARPAERFPGMPWITSIKMIEEQHGHVVIDLPPGLEYSLAAVATVSDMILIPVLPGGVDFHSTAKFIDLLRKCRQFRRDGKPDCVVVPNRVDRRTAIARDLTPYDQFEERVAPPVYLRTDLAKAFDEGVWIGDFAPHTHAYRDIRRLADFVAEDDRPTAVDRQPRTSGAAVTATGAI